MLRADLQEERSAAQRQGPAGEGASLVPVQDPDVVRDGGTYYLVINNLGEQCLRRTFHWLTVLFPLCDLEGNEWEEHPKYCLTGEGGSVATKGASTMYSTWHAHQPKMERYTKLLSGASATASNSLSEGVRDHFHSKDHKKLSSR